VENQKGFGCENKVHNFFKETRYFVTFQFAVFYTGKECLGSARIILLGPSLQSLGHGEQYDYVMKASVSL
jgi:hypothetical protein